MEGIDLNLVDDVHDDDENEDEDGGEKDHVSNDCSTPVYIVMLDQFHLIHHHHIDEDMVKYEHLEAIVFHP